MCLIELKVVHPAVLQFIETQQFDMNSYSFASYKSARLSAEERKKYTWIIRHVGRYTESTLVNNSVEEILLKIKEAGGE